MHFICFELYVIILHVSVIITKYHKKSFFILTFTEIIKIKVIKTLPSHVRWMTNFCK